jgi:hypothetical protein
MRQPVGILRGEPFGHVLSIAPLHVDGIGQHLEIDIVVPPSAVNRETQ